VQSSVALTIYPVDDNLNYPSVTVMGTIDNTNYAVWVNGVEATYFYWYGGAYYWMAFNVPVNGAGSVVFQARAIPYADHDGNGTVPGGGGTNSSLQNPGNPDPPDYVDAEINQDKPPAVICLSYHQLWQDQFGPSWCPRLTTQTIDWSAGTGGSSNFISSETNYNSDGSVAFRLYYYSHCQWDTNGHGTNESVETLIGSDGTNITTFAPSDYFGPTTFSGPQGQSRGSQMTDWYPETGAQSASVEQGGRLGGRDLAGEPTLCSLAANAQQVVDPWYPSQPESWDTVDRQSFLYAFAPLDPQRVYYLGRPQGADGLVWALLPKGEVVNLGLAAPGVPYWTGNTAINTASLTNLTVVSNSATQINSSTNWVGM
jgi:hypothetical protein